ncbi:MAG: hypothetical protein A2937_04025 [Candidatus Yonathbacteria bacterium RIFCSPLOWO2_01_FULL_47_33b]|uniref:Bacterial Ig-like domain-containing protein n=1 Tax=Candidatus Yonathbacteria bacterium RIFCSPLOWO2_01_FULL_47_33b TaxID=1802727 RepID=A0A1G2SFR2_9BACT|nr:MAG: hypothetical protein A2937_04025 [Candidatus Yonathbacteria bacterium RIFCSPLOWO2_01_FULL_47_33b]
MKNNMKKIIGVVMGVSFLSAMAYTALAADFLQNTTTSLTNTTTGSTDTMTTTSTSDTTDTTVKTADTQVTATPTTDTITTSTVNTATAPTTQITSTQTLAPIKAYVVLQGGDTTISGTERVVVKVSRKAQSVGVGITPAGSSVVMHLGQATFDPASAQWVYAWDSLSRTQNGSYLLFARVEDFNGVVTRSSAIQVTVKNEKSEEAVTSNTSTRTAPAVTSTLSNQEYLRRIEAEKQRRLEQAQQALSLQVEKSVAEISAQPAVEQRVISKTGIIGTTARPSKLTTPVDYEKVINEKSQELKDALEKGDTAKRQEVIAEIVRTARGGEAPVAGAVDPLTQKVEDSVLKLEQVLTEQERGVVDETTFKVEAVQVAEVITKPDGTQTASKLTFRGKALPNSFVTVYIFSLPIVVTVKTDSEGNWNYTLDKELEDGNHQVYVGITDVKGKVVVKSNPLPFVKTASAITVEEALAIPQAQAAPSFVQNNYFYGIVTVIILVLISVFLFLGVRMSKTTE